MLKRWLNKAEPIGCQIDAGRVRLAQVQGPTSAEPRVVTAERALPDGEGDGAYAQAVGGLVREMLRSSPFRGSRVVSCPPPGAARYVTMRLAPMPAAELAHAAHWKLASDLGVGPTEFKSAVLNVVEVRDGGKLKTEALVVSATLDHLNEHVAALEAAGLEHVAIDDAVCAAVRCTGTAGLAGQAGAPGRRVVLDLREDEAFMAIADGADVAFVRPVGAGLSQLTKMLADLLEMTPAEALAIEGKTVGAGGPEREDASRPADWAFAVPFPRAREAIADASRMYGRELARQVALATYYYSTAAGTAAPETGVVVSDRTIDPAVLEAVTVQSGLDLSAFAPAGGGAWSGVRTAAAGLDPSTWATAVGLSLYEHGLPPAKEAA